MLASIDSFIVFTLIGLKGVPVTCEVDVNNGLPALEIVGLPDTAVKESKERMRSAIKNSGFLIPTRRITVNLAPADVKKEGSNFDLSISIGLLISTGQLVCDTSDYVFLGELSLDGSIRKINGILPTLISAREGGFKKFIIPFDNQKEASFIDGIEVYPAKTLKEVVDHLSGLALIAKTKRESFQKFEYRKIMTENSEFFNLWEITLQELANHNSHLHAYIQHSVCQTLYP